jgi:hypothetical protein
MNAPQQGKCFYLFVDRRFLPNYRKIKLFARKDSFLEALFIIFIVLKVYPMFLKNQSKIQKSQNYPRPKKNIQSFQKNLKSKA